MRYGIVINVNNKDYLQLTSNYSIQGFEDIEGALAEFKSFSQSYFSGIYESYVSSGMGLINLKPRIIELPEDPLELKEYMLQDTATYLKGIGFGYSIDVSGIEVSEKIEELVVIDVAHGIITNGKPI